MHKYTLWPANALKNKFTLGDALALVLVVAALALGLQLALNTPATIAGPDIRLEPEALPWYTLFSVGRMAAAYALALAFTLIYGRAAAYNRTAERVLMPLLDVLQSVPILSFLPVVLLSLSALLPQAVAVELASVVLIFTSQVWNMTFGWYQSLTTLPQELREASRIFRLSGWLRFRTLELPFGMVSLIWNSMMSWSGGWFFLMAAEIFTVGERDFRLLGLGAYLHEAASQGNLPAILWGLAALIATIVLLDQLVWRPLLAWADRFRVDMVDSDTPPTSWFYEVMHQARLVQGVRRTLAPLGEALNIWFSRHLAPSTETPAGGAHWLGRVGQVAGLAVLVYGGWQAVNLLAQVSLAQWVDIAVSTAFTLVRVVVALFLALLWTVPVGVFIGTNARAANILQPVVQIVAAVPATAIFPVFLLVVVNLAGGLDVAAILLMLMGTQWYLLFNLIAGASAIPQDLKYTAALMGLSGWARWRTLILPALFPYLITGAITASGGAWNASIVAEYVEFGGQTLSTTGIGALIAQATAQGDFAQLLAATLTMVFSVVLINRLVWRPLYQLAADKYRLE